MPLIHVVGAGLAGLACATALAEAGRRVVLHEGAPHAGGRCRSYRDPVLGCRIDNGNHLLLSANREALTYLDRVGGRDGLITVEPAALPFVDLETGERWTLRPNPGPLPLWLLDRTRRVPGATLMAHLAALGLATAGRGATVGETLDLDGVLGRRLWRPLAVSILNTAPEDASARLLWAVFARTLLKGEAACRPLVVREGLSETFIDPGLSYLATHGVEVRVGRRVKGLERSGLHALGLQTDEGVIPLAPEDGVVLALPATVTASLLPEVAAPARWSAIVNGHFRLPGPARLPGGHPLLGVVGGTMEWVFARGDVLSVTVSAADRLDSTPNDRLAEALWADVCRAADVSGPLPPHRIVREKRATFAATPAVDACRPPARSGLANVLLAGDWTDTGLPATIEGAILSGHRAARLCLDRPSAMG